MKKCIYPGLAAKDLIINSDTSSTAQSGGGSFKSRKTIGEIGDCTSSHLLSMCFSTLHIVGSLLFKLSSNNNDNHDDNKNKGKKTNHTSKLK